MTRPKLSRTLRWRPLDGTGLEHLEIVETAAEIRARSVLVGEFEGLAFGAQYEVVLDTGWLFRSLALNRMDGMSLTLHSNGSGHWTNGAGQALPELNGCIDIDISGSPFTNTLPIRRAGHADNQPQTFSMAWIPLDTLVPFSDGQIYTKLGADRYHYEAADGSFEAELTVDADGFVVHYPGLFERA